MSAGAVRAPLIIPLRSPDLGLHKSHLDTNTFLEITCDTPDIAIYFTVNGSRPTVAKNMKELQNTGTYKFRKPFTLPSGCHTVRAIAVSLVNGNESSMVTKTFDVVKAKSPHGNDKSEFVDDYGFLNELKSIDLRRQRQMSGTDRPETRESIHRLPENNNESVSKWSSEKNCRHIIRKSSKDQENQVDLKNDHLISADNQSNNKSVKSFLTHEYAELSSHMINKLQEKTDILRCPNCHYPRPVSGTQNFCFQCGVNLPMLSSPKYGTSALENIGVCPYCKAHVPLNLTRCLVCESLLQVQKCGQYPKECRLCTTCGTTNLIDAKSCIVCEARLPTGASSVILFDVQSGYESHPPLPYPQRHKNVRFSTCSYCHRENDLDARYCDWCGLEVPKRYPQFSNCSGELKLSDNNNTTNNNRQSFNSNSVDLIRDKSSFFTSHNSSSYSNQDKVTTQDGFIHCTKCDLPNPKEANYCSFCGLNLMPPPRCSSWFQMSNASSQNEFEINGNQSEKSILQNRYMQPVIANASTQTYGLFYPSSANLRRQDQLTHNRLSADIQVRERTPTLTAISPGRGFWRKQLDHIFAHLKLFTNNNSEFRASIGQPRFGKLLSADLCEASNEAKLTLIYSLPNGKQNTTILPNTTLSSKTLLDVDHDDNDNNNGGVAHFNNNYFNHIKENSCDSQNITHGNCVDQKSIDNKLSGHQSSTLFLTEADHKGSFRPTPNQRNVYNNNTNQSPSRSPCDVVDYRSKNNTNSFECEEEEKSKQIMQPSNKSTSSLRTSSNDKALISMQSSPNVQFGEVGVALLRNSKLSTADLNLLYTLSQPELDIHEIKRLLNEGANPNCINAAKETPLICAVRNGHVDAISILKESGANINATGTSLGNTALHEAVLRGMDGLELAKELLRYGANTKVENSRKETPHGLALHSNCEPLIRLFAFYLGQKHLEEFTRNDTKDRDDLKPNSSLDII
ncbi:hypothetical protein MN116_003979 [Schistosoma mekongi]|uniref:Double zinc ribbon and ankyrin repeat-containing protein 1 n=1 Tax=Schistosoma mekongi TaxID=38744 RepID=A0AAE1ZET0_SCHME|nr:hypothetical protein MN116_003979 [Schistosoma mekongi]